MSDIRTEIANQRVTFCVREYGGQPIQYMDMVPVAFHDYQNSQLQADYVVIEIHVVIDQSRSVAVDYIPVGTLMGLAELLIGYQNGVGGSDKIETVTGHVELKIKWCEVYRDARFAVRMPPCDESQLLEEHLRQPKNIHRFQSFHFAVEPAALIRPIAQLQGLLDLLRSLKS